MTVVAVIRVDVDGIGEVEGTLQKTASIFQPSSLPPVLTAVLWSNTRYYRFAGVHCYAELLYDIFYALLLPSKDASNIPLSTASAGLTAMDTSSSSLSWLLPTGPQRFPSSVPRTVGRPPPRHLHSFKEVRSGKRVVSPDIHSLHLGLFHDISQEWTHNKSLSSWISLSRFPSRRTTRLPTASMTSGQSTVCEPLLPAYRFLTMPSGSAKIQYTPLYLYVRNMQAKLASLTLRQQELAHQALPKTFNCRGQPVYLPDLRIPRRSRTAYSGLGA